MKTTLTDNEVVLKHFGMPINMYPSSLQESAVRLARNQERLEQREKEKPWFRDEHYEQTS